MNRRPDLSESAWERAKRDAQLFSLGTLEGLAAVTVCGAVGGALTAQADADSAVVDAILAAVGSLLGVSVGLVLATAVHVFVAMRRQRNELRAFLQRQQENRQALLDFQKECCRWADGVERLVVAQEALEPPYPRQDLVDRLRNGPAPEPRERIEERERIQRETVSTYIERFRDEGLRRFDLLVEGGYIVADGRPRLAEPQQPSDLRMAADYMRTASERLL